MSDYDTVEKLERTDRGFRLTIESTRGTGTRDQDKVKAELRSETMPSADACEEITQEVKAQMADLRAFDPDTQDNDE